MTGRRPAVAEGVAWAAAVALAARALHGLLPPGGGRLVGEPVLALGLGLALAQGRPPGPAAGPGLRFCFDVLLKAAIVLLGVKVSLRDAAAIGAPALGLIACMMVLSMAVARGLGRRAGVPPRLATLIGLGVSVCGNTAIAAAAPAIGAKDEELSFAVAVNTLFGTLAVFLYPLLGRALGLGEEAFGFWAGAAVNDTSQVAAAGFAFGERAGEVAVTVKLVRNSLMGAAIVGAAWLHSKDGAARGAFRLPPFIWLFLGTAGLNSLGLFDALGRAGLPLAAPALELSKGLLLLALAALGLSTRFGELRKLGPAPLAVGLGTAALGSACVLALVKLVP